MYIYEDGTNAFSCGTYEGIPGMYQDRVKSNGGKVYIKEWKIQTGILLYDSGYLRKAI